MLAPTLRSAQFELSAIKAIELAAAKIPNSISLAQGIPSFETPQVIRDFVHEKIREGACDKYSLTSGLPMLRDEIAHSLAEDGIHYDPEEEIIATAGSIEGVTASLLAVTEPGQEVILPSPTYASYIGGIRIAGCDPRHVALDEENNFDFNIADIERAINRKTRAILYCNPNNPTGTIYSEENTRRIIELAEKHNLYVIVDEVYKDFYYSDHKHFSPASIPEARQRLIRVCSFSKAYAMTGWRIGFLLGSSHVMREVLKYHDAMVTCAPVVSQYAAIAALRHGSEFLDGFRSEYKKRRDYAISRLDDLSQFLDYQLPSATYFVFPRVKDSVPLARDSHALAYEILEKVGLATVPGVAFGPSGESHLRINFGRDFEDLESGFDRLTNYLKKDRAKTSQPVTTRGPTSASKNLVSRSIVSFILAHCARIYLKRNSAKIIGIAGLAGKTVFKRTLAEVLGLNASVRSNILSYNTRIGLPLSVLGLKSPSTTSEKLVFPFQLLGRTLFHRDSAQYLILEYGATSEQSARELLAIAKPDWLLISRVETGDPNLSRSNFLQALEIFLTACPAERVLYPASEATLAEFEGLQRAGAVDCSGSQQGFVGKSAQMAAAASLRLAELLGFDKTMLNEWLTKSVD